MNTSARSALSFLLLLLAPVYVVATFSQGQINLTRDYLMAYPKSFTSTESFCHTFRSQCVKYAGARGQHHQLDCVFSQAGPQIYAYCGGLKKNADGTWDSSNALYDNTRAVADMSHAIIKKKPMTKSRCMAVKAHNSAVSC